jgi:hypothetical protein
MKNSIRLFLPLVILLISVSCKKNNSEPPAPAADTTPPTISLVDPTAGKSYTLGSTLHLQMDLSDNVELKSYQVVITKSQKGLQTTDWAFNNTVTIPSGKKTLAVNNNDIAIPSTVTGSQTTTGNYDMNINCWDTSNNESSKTITIVLVNN